MKINYHNNPKILNDYIKYLLGIRGYSMKTALGYNSDLLDFFTFIKKYFEINFDIVNFNEFVLFQVKESDVRAYLVYLNFNKNNHPNTRQRKLYAIRSFYKWLLTYFPNLNKKNPTIEIENIEKVEKIPKHLNLQYAKKIQEIYTIENSRYPLRNNAILSLFLSSGIRANELIKINVEDVDFNKNCIYIRGKGNKERLAYFSTYCKKKLLKYLNTRKVINLKDAFFLNSRKERIGIDAIEDICKKAYKLLGLSEYNYTTHTLRHTAATLLYIHSKEDLLLVKEFLGHSKITTTKIYAHIHNEKVKEAIDKNPLNIKIEKIKNREEG